MKSHIQPAAHIQPVPVQEPEPEAEDISSPGSAHKADSEELVEREEQPTHSQIFQAVIKCTASLNTVKDRLGGLTEEVFLLWQDFQKKIRERITAAESRIGDLEDKIPPCLPKPVQSLAWLKAIEFKQIKNDDRSE